MFSKAYYFDKHTLKFSTLNVYYLSECLVIFSSLAGFFSYPSFEAQFLHDARSFSTFYNRNEYIVNVEFRRFLVA